MCAGEGRLHRRVDGNCCAPSNYSEEMTAKYRTEGVNHHGADGTSAIPGGLEVTVASPLPTAAGPEAHPAAADPETTNPEQLLALAWATCLNATARAIVANTRRTSVRVEVELHEAAQGPGYEFHADAYLSVVDADLDETEDILRAAHARCPVSKLLHGAATVNVHAEEYATAGDSR